MEKTQTLHKVLNCILYQALNVLVNAVAAGLNSD